MEKSVLISPTLLRTPCLILTKEEVDSKVLERFLMNYHGNSSQSTSPVKTSPCDMSISNLRRNEMVLKRLVAEPTSLIVSIQLKGREFLLKRLSKNLLDTSIVPSQIQKNLETLSNGTHAKVNEKVQRLIKAPLKSKEEEPRKPLTFALKKIKQDQETQFTFSSNEIHENFKSDPVAAVIKCDTDSDTVGEDVNEVFKVLEEEVNTVLSQPFPQEQNASDQNSVFSNSKSLVPSANLNASLKHVNDAPSDLSIEGNRYSTVSSMLEVETNTAKDAMKQGNRLSAIFTPRADECEDSMYSVLTNSPILTRGVKRCQSTVIPFLASPIVDKGLTSSSSNEEKQNKKISPPQKTSAVEHTQHSVSCADEFNQERLLHEEPIIDLLMLAMETEVLECAPIKEVKKLFVPNPPMPGNPISTHVLSDNHISMNEIIVEDSINTHLGGEQVTTIPSEVVLAMSQSSEAEQSHPNVELVVKNCLKSSKVAQLQVSEKDSKSNNQVAKRPRGRPRKSQTKNAQSSIPVVKRPRGRPKKNLSNISCDTTAKPPDVVKQKPKGFDSSMTNGHFPGLSKVGKKRDKVAKQIISDKKTAELITHAFEKLTSGDDRKFSAHSDDSSTHLQTVEDSGYTTSISNSDTSSRCSCVPFSRSPEVIISPTLHSHADLDDLSFDVNNQNALLAKPDQDPILHEFQNSDPALSCPHVQPPEMDIYVLESGGLDTEALIPPDAESDILQSLATFTLDGVIGENGLAMSADPASDTAFIFPELNQLLSPLRMFCQDDEPEIATSEELEDILKSKAVSRCLEDIKLSELISCGSLSPEITPVSNIDDISITPVVSVVTESSPSKMITTKQKADTSVPKVKGQDGTRKTRQLVRKTPNLNRTANNMTVTCADDCLVSTSLSGAHPKLSIPSVSKPDSSIPTNSIILSYGQTKSGRIPKPSSKLLLSYFNYSEEYLQEDVDSQVPLPPTQPSRFVSSAEGARNLSPCDKDSNDCSNPVKSMRRESECDVQLESNKPAVSVPSILPQPPPSCCPGTTVTTNSSFSLKLRDLNVNLSRRPIFHNTSNFSFKMPQQVVESSIDNTVREPITGVQKAPSTFSFSIDTNLCSPAVANSNNCNVSECHLSKADAVHLNKDRVVKFGDCCKNMEAFPLSTPSMSVVSSSLTSSTAGPVSKQSSLHSAVNNSVNMSLDVVLSEMESTNLSLPKSGDPQLTKSSRKRLVRKNPFRSFELPTLSETTPQVSGNGVRIIKYIYSEPDRSTFTVNSTLTNSGMSDLLSPIDVQSSLDEVLQGESLFGEKLDQNVEVEELQKTNMTGEKLSSKVVLKPIKEGHSSANDSQTSPEVFFIKANLPQTEPASVVSPKDLLNDTQISKDTVLGSPNLEKQVILCSNSLTNDVVTGDKQSASSMDNSLSRSAVHKSCASERRVGFKECVNLEEDVIDIHAEDADIFECDYEADSPIHENPPIQMPNKKDEVSQWVAEQQRRLCFNSSYSLSSSPTMSNSPALYNDAHSPGGSNWNSRPVSGGLPPWRIGVDDPFHSPWAHHQTCHNPSPLFAPESPAGPVPNHGHDVDMGGSGSSILGGFCKYFLRGKCEFKFCRFKHAPVAGVPIHVMEAALFQSGRVINHLPIDVLHHYTNDPRTCNLLKIQVWRFTDLVRGILSKNYMLVATSYNELKGAKFYQSFLCRVMEICTTQSLLPHRADLPDPAVIAEKIFADVRVRHEPTSIKLFYHFLKVLSNRNLAAKVFETYNMMRGSGILPNFDVILVMLRLGNKLNHKIFDLLDDLDLCSPPLLCVQQARCINRLLDVVDYQLLCKHSTRAGFWVDKVPVGVLEKLTHDSFLKLYETFIDHQQWRPLITLLDSCPTYLQSIERQQLCEIINSAGKVLGPTDKLENILSKLAEERLSEITKEVWEIVIASCVEKQQSQKASKFWYAASHHKKQLSFETTLSLLVLQQSQHDSTSAITLLKQALADNPSILPPLPMLISLCQAMDAPQDVLIVIYSFFFSKTAPPMAILKRFLELHSKHKVYPVLVEIVKLSLNYNLLLDKLFYQKVLIELRHWGQDQESVSTVYKILRKIEGLEGTSVPVSPSQATSNPAPSTVTSPLQPTSNPAPFTLASSPKIVSNSSTVPQELSVHRKEGVVSRSLSLEDVLQQSYSQDQSSLIKLIEVNASQGQFGAVASILVSLPSSQSHYDNQIVHTVWKAVSNSSLHSANAFSSLVSSLIQSRSVSNSHTSGALFSSDRWLISQLGIALLKSCEQNQSWQSGFVILHHLHQFGIHYVKLSQPNANLPPSSVVDHSPCLVALMAVNICLHIDQVSSALEVFQGCEWAPAKNEEEINLRTKVLLDVTDECLKKGMTQEGWKCLKAIGTSTIMKNFVHVVTNLHNKLLQISLAFKDIEFSLCVYRYMRQKQLQCLPRYFSLLLQNLVSNGQESLAYDVCKAAIADNCYCALSSGDNMFRLTLPMGLVRIELYLLLEDHLSKIGASTKDRQLQPLSICFSPGYHSELENVFTSDFKPPLVAKFTFEKSTATISPNTLKLWLHSHNILLTQTSNPCGQSSMPMAESRPASASPMKVEPQNDCSVKASAVNCDSPLKGRVEIKRKRLASDALESKFPHVPVSKCPKLDKKQFKEEACRVFVEHLKPHYQTGKFKSPSAYTHLLKVLSLNYFKKLKTKGKILPTTVNDQTKTDIKTMVDKLMGKVHVYSTDMDNELGLASSVSSDSL